MFRSPLVKPATITSRFGNRPQFGDFHDGIDLIGSDDIVSIFDGVCIFSGKDQHGGLYVDILSHDRQYLARYLHNSQNLIKFNQEVKTGQKIAIMGSTGHSTGKHLHFGLFRNSKAIDPLTLINLNQYGFMSPQEKQTLINLIQGNPQAFKSPETAEMHVQRIKKDEFYQPTFDFLNVLIQERSKK